jgi:hypothetical protein
VECVEDGAEQAFFVVRRNDERNMNATIGRFGDFVITSQNRRIAE